MLLYDDTFCDRIVFFFFFVSFFRSEMWKLKCMKSSSQDVALYQFENDNSEINELAFGFEKTNIILILK